MPSYTNPNTIDTGTQKSAPELQSNFDALQAALNGGLDEVNVPNLSAAFTTYKTILWGGGLATNAAVTVGGTYFLTAGPLSAANTIVTTTGSAYLAFHLDPADFAANARTTKLRLKVSCIVNGAAPATNVVPGLYPVATFGGAAGATPTVASLGAVVAGSTVAFTTPALSSAQNLNSGDFNFPAAGHYVLAMAAGGGFAVNSQVQLMCQLQVRQV